MFMGKLDNMKKNISYFIKKNIFIVLVLIGLCPVLAISYAKFTINSESYRSNEMYISELLYSIKIDGKNVYSIDVEPGETEHTIEITSLNAVSTNYKLAYLNNNNLGVKYATDYLEPSFGGIVTTRKISLTIKNTSTKNQTLSLMVFGGYSFNNVDDIKVLDTYTEILDDYWKYDYETTALYVDNTRVEKLDSNKYYSLKSYTCSNNAIATYDTINRNVIIHSDEQAKCSLYFTESSNIAYSYTYDKNVKFYTFEVPKDAYYKLQVWGAQGGGNGGKGGYAEGTVALNKGEVLYIYVGSAGQKYSGGYNGGGNGQGSASATNSGYGGGGATHIAKKSGLLSALSGNKNTILIVAGGGGGSGTLTEKSGGNAGGYLGNDGTGTCYVGKGGAQIVGGTAGDAADSTDGLFGSGGNNTATVKTSSAGGGGAGYYGGGSSSYSENTPNCVGGGAGGSSYIGTPYLTNKVMYCNDCSNNTSISTKTTTNTCASSNPTEKCSKLGDGYATIIYVKDMYPADDTSNISKGYTKDFILREKEEIFSVPKTGNYRLEVWGAEGGGGGGTGAYARGVVKLTKGEKLYVYVGGGGHQHYGGYNGGGTGQGTASENYAGYGGGGATHISKKIGLLSSLSSDKSDILIVAGGGGGSETIGERSGGNAGGYVGNKGTGTCYAAEGGSQNAGGTYGDSTDSTSGSFGKGGNNTAAATKNSAGGGGAGYYGGGGSSYSSSNPPCVGGGGGGSSYIGNSLLTSKVMYCNNCKTSSDANTYTISNTCAYEEPTAECSKRGNGYARITYIENDTK